MSFALPSDSADTSSFSCITKVALCLLGLGLFATNPWRDFYFYKDIADHEGFGTTTDSYIVGVAGQLMATVFLFRVAIFLIIFGIAYSTRFAIVPRFDRFTWGWGLTASFTAVAMLIIESGNVVYGLPTCIGRDDRRAQAPVRGCLGDATGARNGGAASRTDATAECHLSLTMALR